MGSATMHRAPRSSRCAGVRALTARRLAAPVRVMARHVLHGLRLPLRWLARQEAVVLLTAFGIVLTLYGFLEIVDELQEGEIDHFDEWLLRVSPPANDPGVLVGPAVARRGGDGHHGPRGHAGPGGASSSARSATWCWSIGTARLRSSSSRRPGADS